MRRPVSVAINVSIQNTSLNWKRNSLEYFIDSRYFSYSGGTHPSIGMSDGSSKCPSNVTQTFLFSFPFLLKWTKKKEMVLDKY